MHALRRIQRGHASALCAFAVVGIYLVLIAQQGDGGGSRVAFVAASIATAGVAAAAAESSETAAGALAAAWAAATLWVWVLLAAFSIGLLIVPAAIFSTLALRCRRPHPLVVAAGIVLALLIAGAGLAWTSG